MCKFRDAVTSHQLTVFFDSHHHHDPQPALYKMTKCVTAKLLQHFYYFSWITDATSVALVNGLLWKTDSPRSCKCLTRYRNLQKQKLFVVKARKPITVKELRDCWEKYENLSVETWESLSLLCRVWTDMRNNLFGTHKTTSWERMRHTKKRRPDFLAENKCDEVQ